MTLLDILLLIVSSLSYLISCTTQKKPIKSHMVHQKLPMLQSKNTVYNESLEPKGEKYGRCRGRVSLSIKCVLAYACGLISSWAGLARLGSRQLSSKPSGEVNYLLYLKSAENSTLQSRTQDGVCEGLIVLRRVYLCIHMCVCVPWVWSEKELQIAICSILQRKPRQGHYYMDAPTHQANKK